MSAKWHRKCCVLQHFSDHCPVRNWVISFFIYAVVGVGFFFFFFFLSWLWDYDPHYCGITTPSFVVWNRGAKQFSFFFIFQFLWSLFCLAYLCVDTFSLSHFTCSFQETGSLKIAEMESSNKKTTLEISLLCPHDTALWSSPVLHAACVLSSDVVNMLACSTATSQVHHTVQCTPWYVFSTKFYHYRCIQL